MGPPTFPKVVPQVFIDGPAEIVDETLDGGRRRCREMFWKSMETRGSDPYGSPFGNPLPSLFCYFGISLRLPNFSYSRKSKGLGAGVVAADSDRGGGE